ncbi:MAG TPA: carbamoyltransferase C-terminal domain-containing protein [Planctomycetota bacterium]
MSGGHVLGLNLYTHTAACCLLGPDGEARFASAKERLTRKKWEGGDVAELVECALDHAGIGLDALELVVANNHLFRIGPYERTLPWTTALHQYRPSCLSPFNLQPGVPRLELSHHLAHAWSVLPLVPFDAGLIVVMDGIGNVRRDVLAPGSGYHTDTELPQGAGFVECPAAPDPAFGWREAETVFSFQGLQLQRLFKRWTCERTPTFLHNYGFENMDSLGALYSRVSSHVFGDWNACGKVMGLAPWDGVWNADRPARPDRLLRGPLEDLAVNWPRLENEPAPNAWDDPEQRPGYARLAAELQTGLEDVVLDFLQRLRARTGARHVALTGGVALNCTLNGRLARESGFETVFVPPYPGDDGVAVGCALFGHHRLRPGAVPRRRPFAVAMGRSFAAEALDEALAEFAEWVEAEPCADPHAVAAEALDAGAVVGWFRGRSEFGPRALGQRSLLADPRRAEMVAHLNEDVKQREDFRPFAPAVLAERADEWFEDPPDSPWMSFSAPVRAARRAQVPAVVHADGSARLQTVREQVAPDFHALLQAFEARTGVPMVLNTSFNAGPEPIVDSPQDALRTFHDTGIDVLFLEDRLVRARPFPAGEGLFALRPEHDAAVTTEIVSTAAGDVIGATILAGGRTLEADAIEVGLLEACDGEESVADLLEGFAEQFEVEAAELLTRLERLWRLRLVRFGA